MKTIFTTGYVLAIILLSLMSCDKIVTNQTFTIGNESYFLINRLYYSSDGQYTIFIKEINDSRCPEGVYCIWSGEVSLKGEWTYNGIKQPFELHSVLKDQQIEPDGWSIQIVDAKPYPKYGIESKPEDLVITLKIQKK
jgi:hypothetical protein